jgi:carboxylesterase type B
MYGADAEKLLALYPADQNFKHNAQLAARDITLGTAMRRWAMGQASASRKPAYVYMTATLHHYAPGKQPAPDAYETRAFHGSDNAFWLDNLDGFNASTITRQWTKADYAVADRMSDMLVAFVKTGNPSIAGATVPRYDPKNEELLSITVDGMQVSPFPGRDSVVFLHGLKIAPRQAGAPRRPS